jgi:hypothetical protein
MKAPYSLGVVALIFAACSTDRVTEINVTNPSGLVLTQKAVTLERTLLKDVPEGKYALLMHDTDTVPNQPIDTDHDGQWDQLFFVMDLAANASTHLHLTWIDEQPAYPVRTNIRFGKRDAKELPVRAKSTDTLYAHQVFARQGYQAYQTDGPSWENDKVGFRHYFDGRNSKDFFGKTKSYMSPDTVGVNKKGEVVDNYHVMADWGRDVLAVGNSVGLGGINVMLGDSLSRIGCIVTDTVTNIETSVFRIDVEGPVLSQFQIQHNNWKPLDRTYQVNETIRIWPGMYAFQNNVSVAGLKGDETLLVGLVNSNTPNPLKEIKVDDDFVILMTHDQQTYDRVWWLGLALVLPQSQYQGYGEAAKDGIFSKTFYGKLSLKEGEPVTYYALGGWELSDERFKEPEYFESLVTDFARQLAIKVSVTIE